MKVLVTGHPRSGTGYMSRLLNAFGLDVGHEEIGSNGVSSWMLAAKGEVPFGVRRENISPDLVIHVVRDPVKVISSTFFTEDTNEESFNFRKKFLVLSGTPVEQTVQSVIGWNKLIESQAPDIRIKVEDAIPDLTRLLQCEPEDELLPETNYNSREHDQLSLGGIRENLPFSLYEQLIQMINRYEYSKSS